MIDKFLGPGCIHEGLQVCENLIAKLGKAMLGCGSGQSQLHARPRRDVDWKSLAHVPEVDTTHRAEQVNYGLKGPILKLPLVAIGDHQNNPLPLLLSEILHAITNLKR